MSSGRAQRGQCDVDDGEAVVEVVAEEALVDGLRERPVGRRDDPHVDRTRHVAADGTNASRLERPEQLGLQFEGQLADLVEEERAAVGLFEHAAPIGYGAAEGTADMAKELALEEVGWDGPAVDRHERPSAAPRERVHRLRDHLLARAGLALEEHRRLARGDPLDRRVHAAHLDAPADELTEFRAVADLDERGLVVHLDAERACSDAHEGPAGQVDVAHANAVDERTVRAPTVAERHGARSDAQLAVDARDLRVRDAQQVARGAADGGVAARKRHAGAARGAGHDDEVDRWHTQPAAVGGHTGGGFLDEVAGQDGGRVARKRPRCRWSLGRQRGPGAPR
jgi:hypothetical protein